MDINPGNFREKAVNDDDFTSLAEYIRTASFSKTRLYLIHQQTKKFVDIAVERVGCESPLFVPSDNDNDFNLSSSSLGKFIFPLAASATEKELSEDLPVHTLIGSSVERSIRKDECD